MTNRAVHQLSPARCRGITLIEVLVVIGVLVLFLSFAIPSVGTASSRAELQAAFENVSHSLATARNIARSTESGVAVNIPAAGDGPQTISFSTASQKPNYLLDQLQPYRLPADIMAVSERDVFQFDSRGLAENPGQILLLSRSDDSVRSAITVN